MIVLFHAIVCAFKDLSSPFWVNDVKLITSQAVEAILDAAGDYLLKGANFSLLCTLPGPG